MNASLGERLIVPAVVWAVVAAMSGGFMFTMNGATKRMRVIWLSAMLYNAGLLYSIAWKDKLANAFGSKDAWVFAAFLLAIVVVLICRRLLQKQSASETEHDSDR
jgi:hypothetical protein